MSPSPAVPLLVSFVELFPPPPEDRLTESVLISSKLSFLVEASCMLVLGLACASLEPNSAANGSS